MSAKKDILASKKLIVFDLDGTLAESKSAMDAEMAGLVRRLLEAKQVAVISGGRFEQFKKQFLGSLQAPSGFLKNLFLFPTTSTSFYRYRGGWKKIYAHELSKRERRKIFNAFKETFAETGYAHPQKRHGEVIEDRGTQVTFSALGQKAPVAEKKRWNKNDVRPVLMRALRKRLPEFEVKSGGLTSIDVTRKGIDKAYGIRQIRDHLNIPVREMLFVGDALYPGGNDYAARRTGVDCVQVPGPSETKRLIRTFL